MSVQLLLFLLVHMLVQIYMDAIIMGAMICGCNPMWVQSIEGAIVIGCNYEWVES